MLAVCSQLCAIEKDGELLKDMNQLFPSYQCCYCTDQYHLLHWICAIRQMYFKVLYFIEHWQVEREGEPLAYLGAQLHLNPILHLHLIESRTTLVFSLLMFPMTAAMSTNSGENIHSSVLHCFALSIMHLRTEDVAPLSLIFYPSERAACQRKHVYHVHALWLEQTKQIRGLKWIRRMKKPDFHPESAGTQTDKLECQEQFILSPVKWENRWHHTFPMNNWKYCLIQTHATLSHWEFLYGQIFGMIIPVIKRSVVWSLNYNPDLVLAVSSTSEWLSVLMIMWHPLRQPQQCNWLNTDL